MIKGKINYVILLCLIFFSAAGCGAQITQKNTHRLLYMDSAAWISNNIIDDESIAGLETGLAYFPKDNFVAIPLQSTTPEALTIIRQENPDYVLTFKSMLWNGVIRQPWFQQHYKPLDAFYDNYDPIAPAVIYGAILSPFDAGETITVAHPFINGAPEITSYRINTNRLLPGRNLYLTLGWESVSLDMIDQIFMTFMLYSNADNPTSIYTQMDPFHPEFENSSDAPIMKTHHTFVLPSEIAVGEYSLRVMLSGKNNAPYPVRTNTGEEQDFLDLLELERPLLVSTQKITPGYPTAYDFIENNQPVIALSGYDTFLQIAPGTSMRIDLVWHTIRAPVGDYTVFIHVRDAGNNVVAQSDTKPINWTYPTNQWQTGQYIFDEHTVVLPKELASGRYFLIIGLYDAQTGQRLPAIHPSGNRLAEDEVILTPMRIR